MAKGTKMAGKMAGKMKAASAALKGERGIFRKLKEEHAEVSAMMKRCAGADDASERSELFHEIRRELLAHAKGEEREFYPVFRQFEETADLVEESIEDHGAIEEMIDQLRSMSADSEDWTELFDEMMSEVEDHVAQEENELFPLAEKLIDDDQAEQIEERYLHSKEQILRQVA
jgi:hemerythrin superfamily protein